MQMPNSTLAKLQFLAKIKKEYPALYGAAMRRHGFNTAGMSGLGDTAAEMIAAQNAGTDFPDPLAAPVGNAPVTGNASTPWYQSILNSAVNTIQQLAPVYVSAQQSQTCIKVNAARAQQGLAPIDCAAGGLAPQVSVGVSPGVKTLIYVGLAVAAVAIIPQFMKHRRARR